MEIDEVLEASRVASLRKGSRDLKIAFFSVSSSVAASMARSVWPISVRVSAGKMWARPAFIAASSMMPRLTWRDMLRSISLTPASIRSRLMSFSFTS